MSDESLAWLRKAEQGWTEITEQDDIVRHTFVSGEAGALSVRYFRTAEQVVWAKAIFGPRTLGPPGCAHGGSMAALLDEVMGFAVWCSGRPSISADLHVHYRKMLPIPQRCIAEARVERREGRKVWASARLRDISGDILFAEAEGVFVAVADRG